MVANVQPDIRVCVIYMKIFKCASSEPSRHGKCHRRHEHTQPSNVWRGCERPAAPQRNAKLAAEQTKKGEREKKKKKGNVTNKQKSAPTASICRGWMLFAYLSIGYLLKLGFSYRFVCGFFCFCLSRLSGWQVTRLHCCSMHISALIHNFYASTSIVIHWCLPAIALDARCAVGSSPLPPKFRMQLNFIPARENREQKIEYYHASIWCEASCKFGDWLAGPTLWSNQMLLNADMLFNGPDGRCRWMAVAECAFHLWYIDREEVGCGRSD